MNFSELVKSIRKCKLIDLGFCKNRWVWFHILAGSLIFNILLAFNVSLLLSILITIGIAVLWEVFEFYIECGGSWAKVIEIYGSIEKWKYDVIGDILGVILVIGTQLVSLL